MKAFIISLLSTMLCLNASAQSNFYKLSLGAGYGATQAFADLPGHKLAYAAYGTADYFLTPFVSFGGELQMGKITGNDNGIHGRQFINSYKTATINGKLYLGALIDDSRNNFINAIKWLYIGAGAGLIHNKMNSIVRSKTVILPNDQIGTYVFPGKNTSKNLVFPVNLGINFYFRDRSDIPRFAINVNVQSNVTIGEGLDGYDDSPLIFENGNPDIYNYYSVGIKYHFGQMGLSKKSL